MKKFELPRFAGAVSLCLALGVPGVASATEGYFALAYGPAQRGVGGAGVAYSVDPMSAAINPANIADIGHAMTFGLEAFSPRRGFDANGAFPLPDGGADSGHEWFAIPNFGYNRPLEGGGALNVMVYGNGGMNTSYPDVANPNCAAAPGDSGIFCDGKAGVDLMQMFVSVGYGRKDGNFSWGIAPTFAAQRFAARGLNPALFGPMTTDASNFSGRGYDISTGFGLRAGLKYEISPQVTVGVAGQTRFKMTKFDKYAGLFEDGGSFDIPASISAGVTFKPRSDLALMLDYQRIFYSNIAAVGNSNTNGLFGAKGGAGFGWDDVDVVRIGAEWQQTPDMTWRAGYAYATNPIGKEDVMLGVLAPGVVEHHFSFGGAKKLNERDTFDFAINYVAPHKVKGPGMFGGDVELDMHQFSASVGWTRRF
ncbi:MULTISPECIES: outer membrane protein transport protein [unclassified Thioclava]|uniref:OmpP1/FadL family transporter n=1 Tax=unclassified Thioclava TaxID=2621713 RepID=UPI00099737C3|nr:MULTISPECIES: outer membrane protein transport protein [unclassified Thioclava]OOY03892.1 hydrocarbon degradation protein [Thioclava sp. F28-4]OOY16815.1 hydrocarbon degradation protein [Thioclava sp. DLFJ4-1]